MKHSRGSMQQDELQKTYEDLCTDALAGTLSLKRFVAIVAELESPHPYYDAVRSSVAEGVEHLPAKLLSRQVDTRAWRASDLFGELWLHRQLLRSRSRPDVLLDVYRAIEPGLPLSPEEIDALIAERLEASTRF